MKKKKKMINPKLIYSTIYPNKYIRIFIQTTNKRDTEYRIFLINVPF